MGDSIDMTTLLVRINYADGRSEVTPILESMVTYDFSKAGQATVTIDVNGMVTTYTVTVEALPETEAPTEEATEAPTEEATDAPTTPVTEDVTQAPATEEAQGTLKETTTEATSGGCSNSVALSGLLMVVLSGCAVLLKKKEH